MVNLLQHLCSRFEDEKSFRDCTQSLHAANKPLVLDEMYLDTTFLSTDYETFPSRREAEQEVWVLARDWLNRNRKARKKEYVVRFHLPAR